MSPVGEMKLPAMAFYAAKILLLSEEFTDEKKAKCQNLLL